MKVLFLDIDGVLNRKDRFASGTSYYGASTSYSLSKGSSYSESSIGFKPYNYGSTADWNMASHGSEDFDPDQKLNYEDVPVTTEAEDTDADVEAVSFSETSYTKEDLQSLIDLGYTLQDLGIIEDEELLVSIFGDDNDDSAPNVVIVDDTSEVQLVHSTAEVKKTGDYTYASYTPSYTGYNGYVKSHAGYGYADPVKVEPKPAPTSTYTGRKWFLTEESLEELLKKVYDVYPDLHTVISSTWRSTYTLSHISRNLPDLRVIGRTESFGRRDDEILDWLDVFGDTFGVTEWVALDDRPVEQMSKLGDNYVITETSSGVTEEVVNKLIQVLGEGETK